jgi:hypothetical protein
VNEFSDCTFRDRVVWCNFEWEVYSKLLSAEGEFVSWILRRRDEEKGEFVYAHKGGVFKPNGIDVRTGFIDRIPEPAQKMPPREIAKSATLGVPPTLKTKTIQERSIRDFDKRPRKTRDRFVKRLRHGFDKSISCRKCGKKDIDVLDFEWHNITICGFCIDRFLKSFQPLKLKQGQKANLCDLYLVDVSLQHADNWSDKFDRKKHTSHILHDEPDYVWYAGNNYVHTKQDQGHFV